MVREPDSALRTGRAADQRRRNPGTGHVRDAYVQDSLSELFVDNLDYPPLLPILFDDPAQTLHHLWTSMLSRGPGRRWRRGHRQSPEAGPVKHHAAEGSGLDSGQEITICKIAICDTSQGPVPMSPLQNPQHEAFAQARAKGAGLQDAFEDAGYPPDRSHAYRLAKREDVAARIATLRAEREQAEESQPQMIIDALMRMARDSEALKTPAGMKEARLNLLEADRLRTALTRCNNIERYQIYKEPAA